MGVEKFYDSLDLVLLCLGGLGLTTELINYPLKFNSKAKNSNLVIYFSLKITAMQLLFFNQIILRESFVSTPLKY